MVDLTKRLHIATLGLYRNMLVEHVIAKRGADKIAIIYTEKNEDYLEEMVKKLENNKVPVITRKVPPWDYHEVLSTILEIVTDHENYRDAIIKEFLKVKEYTPIFRNPYFVKDAKGFGASFFLDLFVSFR